MRRTNLALEFIVLACGLVLLGIVSAFFWFITGKIPHALLYAMLFVCLGCVIAGIEERFKDWRDDAEELKKDKR